MPAPSAKDHGRLYFAYFCLFLLFAIAVTSYIRTAADHLGILLDSDRHVRDPFEFDGPEMTLVLMQAEARAAGIRMATSSSALTDNRHGVHRFLLDPSASPAGRTAAIQVRSSAPGATPRDISIELQPAFPSGPQASDWLSFAIENLAIPVAVFCARLLGRAVRIRDRLAWLLLVLLLSFAEMFGGGGYASLYGRTDLLQPFFAGYHVLFSNLFSAALLLFALYFPEQLRFDRKFPWAKWLVAGPLIIHVAMTSMFFRFGCITSHRT